jgi:hypothetical protein
MVLFSTRVKLRNEEYVVPGDQWPLFIYKNYSYDPNDPWNGAFQSELLVKVSPVLLLNITVLIQKFVGVQTYLYLPSLCS